MTEDEAAAQQGPGLTDLTAEPETHAPDRNLALELARVTEAGAMAAARWVGRGDKNGADGAAVHAMRALINTVSMNGVVVIGEGEKDKAPMLYNGEQVGDGRLPSADPTGEPHDDHLGNIPAEAATPVSRGAGRRVYVAVRNLPRINNGLGVAILSTPKGVMADHDARDANVGGEIICTVF